MEKVKILVVDDEPGMRDSLRDWLEEDGYYVGTAESGPQALAQLQLQPWNVALVDLKMPEMDGLELLPKLKELSPDLPVLIITAYATVDTAVQAMKQGAHDYLVKPIDPEELSFIIERVLQQQSLLRENILLRKQLMKTYRFQDLIGKTPGMQELFRLIRTVAISPASVLIQGESGTGKELVAQAIHQESSRRDGPFIALSCGALPHGLLESELFGYEKGAFTGAVSRQKGKLEMANGGTLFLDDIADIELKTQVDLLRFLQEWEFRRLGGTETIKVDVRVIAATNRELKQEVEKGNFREDLYYRLKVVPLFIPPLRERKPDIPILVEHFLEQINARSAKKVKSVAESALQIMVEYHWPGNVRELENAIEYAAVICEGSIIRPEHLPAELRELKSQLIQGRTLEEMEKTHIQMILKETEGNINQTARILGIHRATLYKKIKKYQLI